ncbi:hypothetical protein KVF89_12680 [Nocardioides carbamazepini]|uniref:hypothetical protein n=1 Tax=Nocardioides carbamazepini TaxID=2854259 RepID=UPI00214A662D|nr:hypothetical protein [Nocardioides carbamazepini]MCR1783391.1 hypothetical protein [Nocardioides carbamazepini]
MTDGGTAPSSAPAPGRRRAVRPGRQRSGDGLGTPRVPRPSFQSRGWRIGLLAVALALVLTWLVWYATTPERLPVTKKVVNANGVVGTPLYVGMFAAPSDLGRTIRISGVRVRTTSDVKLEVTPLLCRRGTIGVTTQPEQFCSDLVNPEGQRLVGGDSIVVKVESAEAALAVVDQVRIAYREDIRWDTQPAGHQQAIVTIAGRP